MSELSTGRDISVILDGSKNIDSLIRGGSKGCCRRGSSFFKLGCLIDYDDKYDLLYEVKIYVGSRTYIEKESLLKVSNDQKNKDILIFQTKPAASKESGDIKVEYNNGKRGTNPDLTCMRSSAVLPQMRTKMPVNEEAFEENLKCIELVVSLCKICCF